MGQRKSRLLTLLKLSPLYLLVLAILYVLVVMDKDFDYLALGEEKFFAGEYDRALGYLDYGIEKKIYRGSRLLDAYLLRAKVLHRLRGYNGALRDLDTIVHLKPNSETARAALSLKGEIFDARAKSLSLSGGDPQDKIEDFRRALSVFQQLLAETEEDDEHRFEYESKAAATAHNLAEALREEAKDILDRLLTDYDEEFEAISLFVRDFHEDYDLPFLKGILTDSVSEDARETIVELAIEARRSYQFAYDLLQDYPFKPFFDATSSIFLAEMFFHSQKYFPAVLECSLALKEPLMKEQRRVCQNIMADVYWNLGCFGKAARLFESILEVRGSVSSTQRRVLSRNILLSNLKTENYQKVIEEGRSHLKWDETDLVVKYCVGAAHLMMKDSFEAIPHLKVVVDEIRRGREPSYLTRSPARRDSIDALFLAYFAEKSHLKALETLNFGVQIFPNDFDFRRKRAGLLDEVLNKPDEAARDYLYLLRNSTRDKSSFNNWYRTSEQSYRILTGYTYADKARQLVDGFERRERSIGGDITRVPALMGEASFPQARGEIPLNLAISEEFLRRGRREHGKSMMRRLCRSSPEILEFRYRLGNLYFQEGDAEQGLKEYEYILNRDPSDFETVLMALKCYRELDDQIGEGRLIQSILHHDSEGLGRWILMRLKFERGKYSDFMKMYNSLNPFPEPVQNDLDLMAAQRWIQQKNLEKAGKMIESILAKKPNNMDAVIAKVMLYLAQPDKLAVPEPPEPEGEPPAEQPLEEIEEQEEKQEQEQEAEQEVEQEDVKGEGKDEGVGEGKEQEEGEKEDPESGVQEEPEEKAEDELEEELKEEPEEEAGPPPLSEMEQFIEEIRSMGPNFYRKDLENLVEILMEADHPELVIRLMEGIETSFPLPRHIRRRTAEAYQSVGEYEKAVEELLAGEADPDDSRWAFGLGILSRQPEKASRRILEDSAVSIQDGEFYLLAAAGAALGGRISDAKKNLALAVQYPHTARFTQYEVEYIDFLTRLLIMYKVMGYELSEKEPPPPEEEPAPSEEGEDLTTEDEGTLEEGEGAPLEKVDETGIVEGEAGDEEEVEDIGEVPEDVSEEGVEEPKPEGEVAPKGEEVIEAGQAIEEEGPGEEKIRLKDKLRTAVDKDTEKGVEGEEEELPLWTADEIILDELTLNERYDHILPEAVYLVNSWRSDIPKGLPLIKRLLQNLSLRRVQALEKECLNLAQEVLDTDPTIGLAARYVLDKSQKADRAKRAITLLAPVNAAVPDDFESLSILTPAFASQKLVDMSQACRTQLQSLEVDPLLLKKIDIDVKLALNDATGALTLSRELLREAEDRVDFQKALCPLLIQLGATPEIIEILPALVEGEALDITLIDMLIEYLNNSTPSPETRELAEMLLDEVPLKQRFLIIAVLARIYRQEGESIRLADLGEKLAEIVEEGGTNLDWSALYAAFQMVASSLKALDDYDNAVRAYEYLYFLKPDNGNPLSALADLHLDRNKVRAAAENLYLCHLLRPWEARNSLKLAHLWFFEMGEFERAYHLIKDNPGYRRENPELCVRIMMGYLFMRGDIAQAIETVNQQRFAEGIKSPAVMYLTAAFYYIMDDYRSANTILDLLKEEFRVNIYSQRCGYLKERIAQILEQIKEEVKKPEKKKKDRPSDEKKEKKKKGRDREED